MRPGQLKVDRLLDLAFFPGRAPRSREYREGCAAALEYRILGARMDFPYPISSCQADAWAAGVEEGHAIWRAALARKEARLFRARLQCCVTEGNGTLDRLIGQH